MAEKKINPEKIQKKALQICEDARAQLILRHPFVGRLGIQIPFIPVNDNRIHTIATNGKVIYIKPEWVCSMPPVTMMASIAHTIWTAALCHSFRRNDYDPRKFDLASDLEVYTLLNVEEVPRARRPDFFEMFPKHLPVEQIVEKLPDGKYYRYDDADVHLYSAGVVSLPEQLPDEQNPPGKKEEDSSSGDGKGNSDESAVKEDAESQGAADGEFIAGKGDKEEDDNSSSGSSGEEGAGNSGNNAIPEEQQEADCECDPAMREVWRQRIIESGQYYKMVYGTLPGELEELVDFFAKSKTNRIQILRRYLSLCAGGEAHWLPPARRFVWQGQYLPSRQDPKLEIVVAVDTSGSIDEEQFNLFFSEISNTVNAFQNYELTLIQCDCHIQDVQVFSKSNPFRKDRKIPLKGRGGTSFIPVFDYIKNKKLSPKVLLYYTDGCGSFPKTRPAYPVLWLLTEKSDVPWGKTIMIGKDSEYGRVE